MQISSIMNQIANSLQQPAEPSTPGREKAPAEPLAQDTHTNAPDTSQPQAQPATPVHETTQTEAVESTTKISDDPLTADTQHAAFLSEAAYFVDGQPTKQDPETGTDVPASEITYSEEMRPETRDRMKDYNVEVLHNESGDFVMGAEHLESGNLYVVGRGTDSVDDSGQYFNVSQRGDVTDLGQATSDAVETWSNKHDGAAVTVTGHSLAGHAAEQAGRLNDPSTINNIISIQGPSIRDQGFFGGDTPLGSLEPHPNTFRITSDRSGSEFQNILDDMGLDGPAPKEIRIPVNEHRAAFVNDFMTDLAEKGGTVEPVEADTPREDETLALYSDLA